MTIMDKQLEFDPALTAITSTTTSTHVIDLGVGRDLGPGPEGEAPLELLVIVDAALTGNTGTLNAQLQGAPDSSGSPGSYVTLIESGVLAIAQLITGATILRCQIPNRRVDADALPRFLRMQYTVGSGPFTAGSLSARIVGTRQANVAYPPGVTVSN